MDFSLIVEHLKSNYYIEVILAMVEIVGLIIGVKFYRGTVIGKLFIFYLGFDFILLLIGLLIRGSHNINKSDVNYFIAISNTLITFVELGVYSFYFILIIKNSFHNYIKIGFLVFFVLMIIYLVTKFNFLTDRFRYISDILGVAEFLLIVPLCFVFYYAILQNDSYFDIGDRPSFWIVTGIFIFSTVSIPYYLISNFLNYQVFGTHSTNKRIIGNLFYYGPFLINLFFLIRGMLCKKALSI